MISDIELATNEGNAALVCFTSQPPSARPTTPAPITQNKLALEYASIKLQNNKKIINNKKKIICCFNI